MEIKNGIYFLLSLFIFVFITCTVNESTGLIIITNSTLNDVSSIKIGDVIICSYIGKESQYEYWFYNEIAGRLKTNSTSKAYMVEEDTEKQTRTNETSLIFKVSYKYKIDIKEINNQNWIFIHKGKKSGSDVDKPWD